MTDDSDNKADKGRADERGPGEGPEARRTVRARISGRVQGVFYRAWMAEEARARGLDGWVRNRSDGTVEALISGPPRAVAGLIEAAHVGPPQAVVEEVTIIEEGAEEPPAGFQIAPTL